MSKSSHKMVKCNNSFRVNMYTFKLISKVNSKSMKFLKLNGIISHNDIMVNNEIPDGYTDIYDYNGNFINRVKLKNIN